VKLDGCHPNGPIVHPFCSAVRRAWATDAHQRLAPELIERVLNSNGRAALLRWRIGGAPVGTSRGLNGMIFDTQVHVGKIFGESFDADGLRQMMSKNEIGAGMVFSSDNDCVPATVVSDAFGFVWVNLAPTCPRIIPRLRS
jgi:hypothetical protein